MCPLACVRMRDFPARFGCCRVSRRGRIVSATTVVCIAGMHRSGTSMVARLLNLAGVYLGREDELIPANQGNPEGHWEHARLVEINDAILSELGGGWDCPPDLAALADPMQLTQLR